MNRRDFIRGAGFLGGGLMAGLLQACAPSAPPAPTGAPAAAAPKTEPKPIEAAKPAAAPATSVAKAAQPSDAKPAVVVGGGKRGGILRYSSDETPTRWDMHGSGLGQVFEIMAPVYNTLITQDRSDPTGETLAPDLAREWTVSPDGLTYTFALQENVKWHDGAPFTSADVVTSLNKMIDPPQGVLSARKELFGSVGSVEAPNDRTVTVKLKFPDASFLDVLAVGWNVIYPKHILDKDVKGVDSAAVENKIGTGPFKMVDFRLNQYVKYERNSDYFRPGLPYLDGLELRFIPDTTARTTSLVGGNLDIYSSQAGNIGPEEAEIIPQQKPRDITVGKIPILSPFVMFPNASKSPFDNIMVRQAISEAVDRQVVTDSLLEGGTAGGLVFPGSRWDLPGAELAKMPGYGPDMEARRARAKQLLSEAGFGPDKPLTIDLMTRPSPDSARVATIVAPMLEAIGAKVNLVPETMTRHAELRATGDFRITINNLTQTGIDPTHLFGTYLHCNLPRNQSRICLPELDKLWDEQRRPTEFEKRKPIVDQLHKGHLEQAAFDIVSWRNGLNGWWNYVKGFSMAPARFTAHARFEDVWFDK